MEANLICKNCGSSEFWKRGHSSKCKNCGKWNTTKPSPREEKPKQNTEPKGESTRVEYGNDYINVVLTSKRMFTVEDIIEEFQIDTDKWELVPPLIITTHEGYRKDREVEWDVEDGTVTHGRVRDSGKLIIAPLVGITARFKLKVNEIKASRAFDSMLESAKTFAPQYYEIKYEAQENLLYEVAIPDLQLGRMVMGESVDLPTDLTPEVMIERADGVVDNLIGMVSSFNIGRILFPVGNDFYDSDNLQMATTHGTVQQDDPRWQMVFRMGQEFTVRTIDKLSQLAPVDVVIVPGNHDETKMFYLGAILDAWYHANPNVTVDNTTKLRKYYQFGSNLIGLTHGYYEKYADLQSLMAFERPQMWAESAHREWHLGDKHHSKAMIFPVEELKNGVVVRILRSLASPSVWEFNGGLVGSLKAAESFLWERNKGLIAHFTAPE